MRREKKSMAKDSNPKIIRLGSYTTFIGILALVVTIAVNMFVNEIPPQFTKFDTSIQKLYTISPQTKEVLAALEQDVILYYIAPKGKYDLPTLEMLKRYESLSSRIKVEYVDPLLYPNFASQYTSEPLYGNDIIVKIGDKTRLVGYADIYDIVYNASYLNNDITYDTVFQGESSLTNAISLLVKGKISIVYSITGHGENEIPSDLIKMIRHQNIELENVNLVNETIPDDAECLLMISPRSDISEPELNILTDYLKNGGNLFLLTDYIDKELPNIEKLTNYCGLKKQDGLIIDPTQSYSMSGYPMYLAPDIYEHETTIPLIRSKYAVLMPVCHGIMPLESYRDSLNIIPILATSQNAYIKADAITSETLTLNRQEGDKQGLFVVGVVSIDSLGDTESKFVWISTGEFIKENFNSISGGANSDLFINAIAWMCNDEDAITIHAKTISTNYLSLNGTQTNRLTVLFLVVMPLSVLIVGIIVWFRRKRS